MQIRQIDWLLAPVVVNRGQGLSEYFLDGRRVLREWIRLKFAPLSNCHTDWYGLRLFVKVMLRLVARPRRPPGALGLYTRPVGRRWPALDLENDVGNEETGFGGAGFGTAKV